VHLLGTRKLTGFVTAPRRPHRLTSESRAFMLSGQSFLYIWSGHLTEQSLPRTCIRAWKCVAYCWPPPDQESIREYPLTTS